MFFTIGYTVYYFNVMAFKTEMSDYDDDDDDICFNGDIFAFFEEDISIQISKIRSCIKRICLKWLNIFTH